MSVFPRRKHIFPLRSGTNLVGRGEWETICHQTGKPYHNGYVFKIDFENEKIATITDYRNVATLANMA